MKWNSVPLLRYLIAFCGGIVFQIFVPGYLVQTILLFYLACLVALIFTYYRKLAVKHSLRWVYGVCISVAFIAAGSLVTFFKTQINYPDHYTKYLSSKNIFIAQLDEPLSEKATSYKTVVRVTGLCINNKIISTRGLLLLYLQKDSSLKNIPYGEQIIFEASAKDIAGAQNPEEFNYKRFMYFHQIYKQVYIRKENIVITNKNYGNPIFKNAYLFRNKLVSMLQENIPDTRQYAVAEALTVGYEDDLDQELIQAYASSGALHVLSVSGMHVGLIYVSLLFLLKWSDKIPHAHHFKYFLLLLLIWFYSLITGLSPSVMRSAAMLTLMIVAKWINRSSNVYNTLAVSAFSLLLLNPYFITEVGFQLSYMAVFGIVFLHPLIYRWWQPSSAFVAQIWLITSVSIAAQTMTFPLGLLYFHQFPNLFILSNLIVIPLSTVVIFGCIMLLALSWIPYASALLGKLVWAVIWLINFTVTQVDKWPYSLINEISISIFETWLIYIMLGFLIFFLLTKKAMQLQVAMVCIIMLLVIQVAETYSINKQEKIIVYSIKNHTAINFIEGKHNVFIADSDLRYNRSSMLFHVTHNWWNLGVYDAEPRVPYASIALVSSPHKYFKQRSFVFFDKKKILLIDSMLHIPSLNKMEFDLAIISKNAVDNLKKISSELSVKKLIIDTSNNYAAVKKIKTICRQQHISYYDVNENGAFVMQL